MDSYEGPLQLPWWQRCTRWRQTSRAEAVDSERALLALARARLTTSDVAVGPGRRDFMHTIHGGEHNAAEPALVYIPGYGAGSGYLFRVLSGLAAGFNLRAVDLLGTGLSGRPTFRARTTAEAEDWFVESLETWREEQRLERMVLMGHSLGGYLSSVYALRYPERVQHLVLVCPAGIGRQPADWQPPAALRDPWTLRGQLFRLAKRMWEWDATPGVLVRMLGPWGQPLVNKYARNRFKQGHHLGEAEVARFERYMYHVLAGRGSGEFALSRLLMPFAWPRQPLEDRMHELRVPVSFIYGEHDWMDPKAAARVVSTLGALRKSGAAAALPPTDLRILTTPSAGHYPFIDQPALFLQQVAEVCAPHLSAAARAALEAAAAALPTYPAVTSDSAAALEDEFQRNPAEAEAHIATDL